MSSFEQILLQQLQHGMAGNYKVGWSLLQPEGRPSVWVPDSALMEKVQQAAAVLRLPHSPGFEEPKLLSTNFVMLVLEAMTKNPGYWKDIRVFRTNLAGWLMAKALHHDGCLHPVFEFWEVWPPMTTGRYMYLRLNRASDVWKLDARSKTWYSGILTKWFQRDHLLECWMQGNEKTGLVQVQFRREDCSKDTILFVALDSESWSMDSPFVSQSLY